MRRGVLSVLKTALFGRIITAVNTGLTLVNRLGHGDANPQTVGSPGAVRRSQLLAVRQLHPLQDERVGAGDDVLSLTQIVLQDLAFVPTKVPGLVDPRAAVTRREGEVTQRRDGKLRAAIGQMIGCPDHGEGRWEGDREKKIQAVKSCRV